MSLLAGFAHELRGDRAAAVRAYEETLAVSDVKLAKQPGDFRAHMSRGLALTGLYYRQFSTAVSGTRASASSITEIRSRPSRATS